MSACPNPIQPQQKNQTATKYDEVYNELTRQKQENKQLEETLFHVVRTKKTYQANASRSTVERKQTIKKFLRLFW